MKLIKTKILFVYIFIFFGTNSLYSMSSENFNNRFDEDKKIFLEAINNRDLIIIEYLISEYGEKIINAQDNYKHTSLHKVAINQENIENCYHDVILILLKNGGNLNLRDNYGRTPLFIAASYNKKQIMKIFIDHLSEQIKAKNINAADIPITDTRGTSLLHLAAKKQSMHLLQFTIDMIYYKSMEVSPFYRESVLETELNRQKPITMQTALHIAVENNNEKMAKYLLSTGANPNIRDGNEKTIFDINKESDIYCYLYSQWGHLQKHLHKDSKKKTKTLKLKIDISCHYNIIKKVLHIYKISLEINPG